MGLLGPDEQIVLPPTLNLSSEKLEKNGIFLVEDGQQIYMWVGKQANPDQISQLFGVPTLENVDTLQVLTTTFVWSLHFIISLISNVNLIASLSSPILIYIYI